MSTKLDICNLALTILGKPALKSLIDPSNAAAVMNVEYDPTRRALISGPSKWRFSIVRTTLAALTGKPASGPYTAQYALPSDFLALVQVGDTWPGLDLSDYRLGPSDADYSIENGILLCDYGSPVSLAYTADITNTNLFSPWFVIYLGAELAWNACERLTGSTEKQQLAEKRRDYALMRAANSNALLVPPQIPADDTWIAARMQ